MSELISGKVALNAWFDGETVFVNFGKDTSWHDFEKDTNCSAEIFKDEKYKFKLKPKTFMLNGIEVPKPNKPESCYSSNGSVIIVMDDNDKAVELCMAIRKILTD